MNRSKKGEGFLNERKIGKWKWKWKWEAEWLRLCIYVCMEYSLDIPGG